MPITDYKITDIERNAVAVENQAPDVLPDDADTGKAFFDAYPDKIRAEHDDMIDYLNAFTLAYSSTADAALVSKGTFDGFVPMGAVINLYLPNGNTADDPTITIDGITYSITGIPSKTSTKMFLRLKKTDASTLAFYSDDEYVYTRGVITTADSTNWYVERYTSGKRRMVCRRVLSFRGSDEFGSTGLYQQTGTIYCPLSGLEPTNFHPTGGIVYTPTTTAIGSHVYFDGSAYKFGVQIARTSTAGVSYAIVIDAVYIP